MQNYTSTIYIYCLSILLSISTAVAQESKLNIDLFQLVEKTSPADYDNLEISLLVKGDISIIKARLEETENSYFKYAVDDIASVVITPKVLDELLELDAVERMEYYDAQRHNFFEEDTIMFSNNNISPAHLGLGDLPQGYLGNGILVGVIDDGFDWRHPDFLNKYNETRVDYFWDQNITSTNYIPMPYGYGSDWDSTEIGNGESFQVANLHGTHVAGIAAGDGSAANNKYLGVAPAADMIWVKNQLSSSWMTAFVDGLHYTYAQADFLGKPCVINSSLGTYASGHDGKDLYSGLISNMIDNEEGRAFVQAGGNAREYAFHLQHNVDATVQYTDFEKSTNTSRTRFYIYADTADFDNVEFAFEYILDTAVGTQGISRWYNVLADLPISTSIATYDEVLFYDALGNPVSIQLYAGKYDGTYEILVELESFQLGDRWRLKSRGQGKFDIWSSLDLMGTADIVVNTNNDPNYTNPDNNQTIAGFWTCAESVITVGAYQNRDSLLAYGGDTTLLNLNPTDFPRGGIWFRSSIGGTRDGRLKPDLSAPGGQVMAAAPLANLNGYQNIGYDFLDIDGWHVSNQGTSMAAPMVAGAVALYLECQPDKTQGEIKQALYNSAKVDSLVLLEGAILPNEHWGYGKLDVYALLQECLVYGCTDENAINYNPNANVDDGTCLVLNTLTLNNATIEAYPNPFMDEFLLDFDNISGNKRITIFDIMGRAVLFESTNDAELMVNMQNFVAGTYWIEIKTDINHFYRIPIIKI